jgi:DUF1680 family protein
MAGKQVLSFISAADPAVQYFGKWLNEGDRRFTRVQYSTCYFNFRGDAAQFTAVTGNDKGIARVYLDGRPAAVVDCYTESEGKRVVYAVDGIETGQGSGIHNLVVVSSREHNPASGGCILEIGGFAAAEPVHYPAYLRRRMTEEYALITAAKKPWAGKESWKPVPCRAAAPDRGVVLTDSPARTLYDRNIMNLKECFALEDYCEGEPFEIMKDPRFGLKRAGHGWSDWLPASNEARLLAGASQALRWEEDPELRAMVNKIVADMKARTREDGYYNYYPESLSFAARNHPVDTFKPDGGFEGVCSERKNYDRVFWTRGMIAAHQAGNPDALMLARRMYDWFNAAEEYLPWMLFSGNATNGMPGGPLMYNTVLGKSEDIITNERFFDQDYWIEALGEKQPLAVSHYPGERPHCYEILALETFADAYRATGNRAYLDALLGGWRLFKDYYLYKGGSTAIGESGGPYPPGSLYLRFYYPGELCGSVFWVWLNQKLLYLYPEEEQYAGEIEETLINTILPCRTEKGHTKLTNPLCGKTGEWALGNINSCCEVSSANLAAALPELIYMRDLSDDRAIYVSLFIPSVYRAGAATLRLESGFPYEWKVRITLEDVREKTESFPVSIRIPAWVQGETKITVNRDEGFTGKPGSWCHINRDWKQGDRIEFEFPLKPRTVLYTGLDQDEENRNRYAICYGPVLMALTGRADVDPFTFHLPFDVDSLEQKLIPRGNLHFEIEGCPDYHLKPYFELGAETFHSYPLIG